MNTKAASLVGRAISALGVISILAATPAMSQNITVQNNFSPGIPVQNFNPNVALQQGMAASQSMFENERKARAYNALRRAYGDAAGDPEAALQMQLYRQRQIEMQQNIPRRQTYVPAGCGMQQRPVFDYRGAFAGYQQVQVCD